MGELFTHFKGYDVQAVRREARAEGESIGETKGEILKLLSQIRKKITKNHFPEAIAEMLEEDISYIQRICDLFHAHPDWDDNKVYTELTAGSLTENRTIHQD